MINSCRSLLAGLLFPYASFTPTIMCHELRVAVGGELPDHLSGIGVRCSHSHRLHSSLNGTASIRLSVNGKMSRPS